MSKEPKTRRKVSAVVDANIRTLFALREHLSDRPTFVSELEHMLEQQRRLLDGDSPADVFELAPDSVKAPLSREQRRELDRLHHLAFNAIVLARCQAGDEARVMPWKTMHNVLSAWLYGKGQTELFYAPRGGDEPWQTLRRWFSDACGGPLDIAKQAHDVAVASMPDGADADVETDEQLPPEHVARFLTRLAQGQCRGAGLELPVSLVVAALDLHKGDRALLETLLAERGVSATLRVAK